MAKAVYEYDKPDNLAALFEETAVRFPDNPYLGTKQSDGTYNWITYRQAAERVDHLRAGLAEIGVGEGDAVGFIANNRAEWPLTAFAAYGLKARFVPMYEKELVKVWKYIIENSAVKVLLAANQDVYEKIQSFKDDIPSLKEVFVIDAEGDHSMSALESLGAAHPVPSVQPSPHDIAALIYTSGTTGNPKGVLLSHGNFTSNVHAGFKLFSHLKDDDRTLSILPWAHSFGQTGELYLMTLIGGSIGFMENVTTLVEDMKLVRPSLLIAVPRVFNKIYSALNHKIEKKGGLAKKLFNMGVEAGKKRRELAKEGKTDFFNELKFKLADRIVFKKIRDQFGGRLTDTISGSATMNVEIGYFFADIGIPVYDCYGLTETTPAATMNGPGAHRPGSVGRTIDKVTIVIDKSFSEEGFDDGEIIVYGPNVMQGYHNNPEATQEVMTEDGGFRTGDRGKLDKDGYLFITGRIKEQYKLENGKYVFPAALEEEIKLLPLIENAMIYGDGRPFNICLLVPDPDMLKNFAGEKGFTGSTEELLDNPALQQLISTAVTDFLKEKFGGYEIPKQFILLSDNFSLDNGMLTQTMKLKRRAVMEQYKGRIEAMYKEAEAA